VATTALVVAMAEARLRPGDGVELAAPLDAMRRFALDPTCRAAVEGANGKSLTAIAIQRHYQALAAANMHASFMLPWAPEACRQWDSMLTQLEGAPASVATSLDWGIKYALCNDRLRASGFPPDAVPAWNALIQALVGIFGRSLVSAERLTQFPGPMALANAVSERGMPADKLAPFLTLRQMLMELDVRFGQLGPKGVFNSLDRAGVLTHRFPGVDNIEHAMANPPALGRARVRGECIRRLARQNGRHVCTWDAILNLHDRRALDLSDPFASGESWREMTRVQAEYAEHAAAVLHGRRGRPEELVPF
jgi:proteasome accessory factor A